MYLPIYVNLQPQNVGKNPATTDLIEKCLHLLLYYINM
jgi:hypothetical protein